MKRFYLLFVVVIGALAGLLWWHLSHNGDDEPGFRTTPVERGNLVATIGATGTLQPEEVVDVGAQVAGRILSFGRDLKNTSKFIDYNSEVEEGTVLAEIDKRLYQAEFDQAEAMLAQSKGQFSQALAQVELSKANLARAEADLTQMKAKLTQLEREWLRVQRIAVRPGAIADTEFDLARANFETSRATAAVADAAILQAKASMQDADANVLRAKGVQTAAEAALRRAKANLDYCTITSPVKGVIIERRVNVGQTVVSSLNAPSLFLIAKDLRKMVIWSQVNEADVGQLRVGQKVRFTVEGRTGEVFKGEVGQIRLGATPNQNVVLYTVVVSIDNNENKLIAYQTCNVTFEIDRRKDVLMVPNGALRWQPKRELVDPAYHDDLAKLLRRRANPKAGSTERDLKEGVLWVEEEGGHLKPINVKTGLTDGQMTEIITDELKEKDRVILGMQQAKGGSDDSNPFAPKMFSGRKPPQ